MLERNVVWPVFAVMNAVNGIRWTKSRASEGL